MLSDVDLVVEGVPQVGTLVFYRDDLWNGGLCGSSDGLVCDLFVGIGPQVFSGTTLEPTFLSGTYGFAPGYRLTISNAVPEPATWAMMIVGFGLVGLSARRRREAVAA